MKVTDVKTFAVDCFRTNWVFVKVYTDEGIDGVGEATLEYKEKALIGAVEHIKEYLVGKKALAVLSVSDSFVYENENLSGEQRERSFVDMIEVALELI